MVVFFIVYPLAAVAIAAVYARPWTHETTAFAFLAGVAWLGMYLIFKYILSKQQENFDAGDYLRIERGRTTRYSLPRAKRDGPAGDIACIHLVSGWAGKEPLGDCASGVSELHVLFISGEEILIVEACGMSSIDDPARRIAEFAGVPLRISKQAVEFNFLGRPRVIERT